MKTDYETFLNMLASARTDFSVVTNKEGKTRTVTVMDVEFTFKLKEDNDKLLMIYNQRERKS